jgi:CopG-like RHH_1 or ribbon-helix-helix domain, RHH_5
MSDSVAYSAAVAPAPPRSGTAIRRLNVNLSEQVYNELQELAGRTGRTVSDLVRLALAVIRVILTEVGPDQNLYVGTRDGKIKKQIVIPR